MTTQSAATTADLSFQEAFAPIAHHLFPDGCPNDEILAEVWPIRTERAAIPFLQAKTALLYVLKRWATKHGLQGRHLDAVALAATHVVSGKSTSRLMSHFKDFLRCLIPRKRNCMLSPFTVQKLLLVRLEDDDRAQLYRLFILCIRNRVLIYRPEQFFSSYYHLIFHHCQHLNDAVHLLHLITKRQHVQPFRAHRLLVWYKTSKRPSIYLLLELYSKFDQPGCQAYVPNGESTSDLLSKRLGTLRKDTWWEKELLVCLRCGNNDEPASKRTKTNNATLLALDGIATWRGQREVSKALINETLLAHVSISDYQSDDEMIQVRTNLPYMLYEEWYVQDDEDATEHDEEMDVSENNNNGEIDVVRRQPTTSVVQIRANIVKALATFSLHLGLLLPEIESFVVDDILPTWDGTDTFGLVLCQDVLPYMGSMPGEDLNTSVLQFLEKFVRFGSPRLQYRILGCLVPRWIRRWGYKPITIHLVRWASKEMKRALLGNVGHELVLLSMIEIYDAVRVTTKLLPKGEVVHILLLSRTPFSINQLCLLLMKYRSMLMREKIRRPDNYKVKQRVNLFNCYVWDICCALWSDILCKSSNSVLLRPIPDDLMQVIGKEQKALSLSHAAAFQGYPSLKKGELVNQLQSRGLTGLHSFLVTFVGALADREERRKSVAHINL